MSNDEQAEFAEFFQTSWEPCLRAVMAVVGRPQLAEDQVAEAFARAWRSWRKVRQHPVPRAWVVRTALNAGASAAGSGTIHTAAFTLSRNADGTATLRLTQPQVFDQEVLQRALAEDGIPALVTSDSWCWSSPALPSPPSLGKVLSVQTQSGTLLTPSTPQDPQQAPPDAVTVINPAKLPHGTELLFDYVKQAPHAILAGNVIYTHAYTCEKGAPPNQSGR